MSKIKNVFEKQSEFKPQFKRNLINLTHRNNLSFNFGQLIPCMCKEVLPGDTFRIDSASLFKAMPLNFPVQTAMKAYVHYYYVRNRVLMDRWEDYITGVTGDDVTPAHTKMSSANYADMFSTGSLGDYLGVPTRVTGVVQNEIYWLQRNNLKNQWGLALQPYYDPTDHLGTNVVGYTIRTAGVNGAETNALAFQLLNNGEYVLPYEVDNDVNQGVTFDLTSNFVTFTRAYTTYQSGDIINLSYLTQDNENFIYVWDNADGSSVYAEIVDGKTVRFDLDTYIKFMTYCKSKNRIPVVTIYRASSMSTSSSPTTGMVYGTYVENKECTFDSNPLNRELLNVLPFRAYEMICNYFYRNERVNPLYIDGKPVYNEFLPTKATGLDTNIYKLHNRNWVSDFLTSAVPSPQMGIAPLVGVSSNVDSVTFEFELDTALGNVPAGTTFTVTSNLDENGNLTGISAYDEITPTGNLQRLRDVISQGISINDLRNASAFQRFLENSLRRGYKYIDNMLAHYGVAPDKVAIQAPEFIGGYTMDINVRQITSTASTEQGNAGDISGQMEISGSLKRKITHYCPEHGFIMGIISVAPMPAYQQVMPKYFFKLNKLDYFFPEFGKIGMQPIAMKEVAPLQTASANLNDTFGYQRPWYDYLGAVDEVHGAFRSSLKDFILTRNFSEIPELGEEFVTIKDEYLNDIWATNPNHDADGHKFFGNMIHDVKVKRQIPVTSVMGEIL